MKKRILLLMFCLALPMRMLAWGNKGHSVVAYLAYQQLTTPQRQRLNALIRLNPCYAEWKKTVSTLSKNFQPVGIYMLSATWPDKIKSGKFVAPYTCQPGHKFISDGAAGPGGAFSEDVPPDTPEAAQNIGYDDTRRHKYWHFVDMPFSTDGTATTEPRSPNALTQIQLLTTAIGSDEPDKIKSFDVVWLTHMIGDVHQPLHDTSRFTQAHPNGDQGGNLVWVCAKMPCTSELHAYWDGLPGSGGDVSEAIKLGSQLSKQAVPPEASDSDPSHWVDASFAIAKSTAYAAPVTDDTKKDTTALPDAAYRKNAMAAMQSQLVLAGNRLAGVLQNNLK